jgi:hypothetical protein
MTRPILKKSYTEKLAGELADGSFPLAGSTN